jgi:hypothetical protein
MTILSKGIKYNLHTKFMDSIKNFASEAETAISYLPAVEQHCMRWQVAKKTEKLHRNSTKYSIQLPEKQKRLSYTLEKNYKRKPWQ